MPYLPSSSHAPTQAAPRSLVWPSAMAVLLAVTVVGCRPESARSGEVAADHGQVAARGERSNSDDLAAPAELAESSAGPLHPLGSVPPPPPRSMDRPSQDAAPTNLFDEALYATVAIADADKRSLVEYGKAVAEETWKYIGPEAHDPSMRISGNGLACKNCHIKTGLQPFSAPWVGVTKRYPTFSDRKNGVSRLEDRINGCMQRSMNGKQLADDSHEMLALVAWMEWLSSRAPADGKVEGQGFEVFPFPDRAVDLAHGKTVFTTRCAACHGAEGTGLRNPAGGYLFPPLAGDDSYNDGAGMNRVLTAAAFVHNNMPQGTTHEAPQLSIEESFDVAGYINSLPRPTKANREADFPDRKLKPMSTSYGPWADDFSAEQHKYGPYRGIADFYQRQYDIRKKK